jgi:hypothetical protein
MSSHILGQFNYPTGVGKGNIQTGFISDEMIKNKFGIYVIVTPRIMLTNQLNSRLGHDIANSKVEWARFTIHSGRPEEFDGLDVSQDIKDFILGLGDTIQNMDPKIIADELLKAATQNRPCSVAVTYHSLWVITQALEIAKMAASVSLYDESHYVTEEQHFARVQDHMKVSDKNFFFTATRKEDEISTGRGHNNVEFYGPILDKMNPGEAIELGFITRPRMQIVEIKEPKKGSNYDPVTVIESFKVHKNTLAGQKHQTAKLLVNCNSSGQMEDILNAEEFKSWVKAYQQQNPKFKVFAICSNDSISSQINGEKVTRNQFLSDLKTHDDDAIIFHIRILTEGIDVPDMTGIMLFQTPGLIKFLQTVGRATRLHPNDRAAFEKGEYTPADIDKMWKKYAWIIIPKIGTSITEREFVDSVAQYVIGMRDWGYEPSELIVHEEWGRVIKDNAVDGQNTSDKKDTPFVADIIQKWNVYNEDEKWANSDKDDLNSITDVFTDLFKMEFNF